MGNSNHLFPNPDPVYKPHLRQSGTITSFKAFEDSLQELSFCKAKLKEAKEKIKHIPNVEIEEIHKIKIKFKKGEKKNAA